MKGKELRAEGESSTAKWQLLLQQQSGKTLKAKLGIRMAGGRVEASERLPESLIGSALWGFGLVSSEGSSLLFLVDGYDATSKALAADPEL